MIFIPFIFSLSIGVYFLYSGINDKPPFEVMQTDDGWHYSRFPNKYWAIATGILFIGGGIYILVLGLTSK